jgi:hypothetical protein
MSARQAEILERGAKNILGTSKTTKMIHGMHCTYCNITMSMVQQMERGIFRRPREIPYLTYKGSKCKQILNRQYANKPNAFSDLVINHNKSRPKSVRMLATLSSPPCYLYDSGQNMNKAKHAHTRTDQYPEDDDDP